MTDGHDLAMSLRATYWAMHRSADAVLQPLGVTANQFVVLSLLSDHPGVTQKELVRLASSDPNTVRAMLLVLEAKGLVKRLAHPTDGRAWCVRLSPKGQRVYKKLKRQSEQFRSELWEALGPRDANRLVQLLDKLTHSIFSKATSSSEADVATGTKLD